MSVVDKREDLDTTIGPDGMQKNYLVLSEAERAKGFVRPVRRSYRHDGPPGPKNPLRDLTADEAARHPTEGYVKFEDYPPDSAAIGRYWTQAQLDKVGKGCRSVTTMGQALAETYARDPGFYGATFCSSCATHFPVGKEGEFSWDNEPNNKVGT